jgi:hypothetical protein
VRIARVHLCVGVYPQHLFAAALNERLQLETKAVHEFAGSEWKTDDVSTSGSLARNGFPRNWTGSGGR